MNAGVAAPRAIVAQFNRLDFRRCKPQECTATTLETTLTSIRDKIEKIRNAQFTISCQLRGYQPQLGSLPHTYDQWKTEISKTFKPQIRQLRKQLKQKENELSQLAADGETTAKLMIEYRALYQELRFLKYQAHDLLLLVSGEAHRSALELYKTTMKECDALWNNKSLSPIDKFKKVHDIAQKAVEKVDRQQNAIKDVKESLLGNEVSTLHCRTLEYFTYQTTNYRKSLPAGDTPEQRELTRIDTLVETKKAEIGIIVAMSEVAISDILNALLPIYLGDTREVTLAKQQEVRQSNWDLWGIATKAKNWWYSGIGDGQVTERLRLIGLSINKVLTDLQRRILELACGNLSPGQDFKDLKEEVNFYRACRRELSRWLKEQQEKLYDADFDEKMHAGIYTIDQRHAGCADIKLHTTMLHLLGTNEDIAPYLRAHGKVLQFLKPDSKNTPSYSTSYEAMKGLFDATMELATIPAITLDKKKHFHRYGQKTYSLVHDTIQNRAQKTITLVGLEQTIQDQVIAGETLESLIKQNSLTDLPEVVKSCIAKEIYRFLFYTRDTTNSKLDLFLHALQKSYKPLLDKAIGQDAQFKGMLEAYSSISDWNSNQKSQEILDLIVTVSQEIGAISRNPSKEQGTPHSYNGELNFVRYCKARQKLIELQSRDNSLAYNSPACSDRIRVFRPILEKQLSDIDRQEEYPGFFAQVGQFLLIPSQSKDPSQNQHLTTIGPEQRVQVLYKHLVTYLFGTSDKKKEIANTLHVLLTHHRPDAIVTLFNDVNEPKQKYVLILLYRFLLECLADADLDNPQHTLSPREYNLLRNLIESCYRKDGEGLRTVWNAQYSPGFMHNALRLLMKFVGKYLTCEVDSRFLEKWNTFYPRLMDHEHYAVWTSVMDAYYRFVKTLKTSEVIMQQSLAYRTLEQQITTATEALRTRPVPEDPTYGDLLAASKWCKEWMVHELLRVTTRQN